MRTRCALAVRAPAPALRRGITAGAGLLPAREVGAGAEVSGAARECMECTQAEVLERPRIAARTGNAGSIERGSDEVAELGVPAGPLPYSPTTAGPRRARLAQRLEAARASGGKATEGQPAESEEVLKADVKSAWTGAAAARLESLARNEPDEGAAAVVDPAREAHSAPLALSVVEARAAAATEWVATGGRPEAPRGPELAVLSVRRAGRWWAEAEAEEDLRVELVR